MSSDNKEENPQRGIQVEASFGQILSAVFLIFLLFVLPVGGYEYLNGRVGPEGKEVYTSASVAASDQDFSSQSADISESQGRVAGISTSRNSTNVNDSQGIRGFIEKSTSMFAGIVMIVVATILLVLTGLYYNYKRK